MPRNRRSTSCSRSRPGKDPDDDRSAATTIAPALSAVGVVDVTPIGTGAAPSTAAGVEPIQILGNVATIIRGAEPATVSHYNIAPVLDIYGNVVNSDLRSVSDKISLIIEQHRKELPRGSQIVMRGQVQTMNSSFIGLTSGLAFSILLVYLLIVVNFQSWLDPFMIIAALPAALCGIVWMLFITGTHISVPALTGSIMTMGVATANSILVISFAREQMEENAGDAHAAALSAGYTRFRPVIMTALAMIIGMIPMALGLGEGGEQNAPLGRSVIGGLLFATAATLFFVPTFFSVIHGWLGRRSEQTSAAAGGTDLDRLESIIGESVDMNQERSDERPEPAGQGHGALPDAPPLSGRVAAVMIVVLLILAALVVVAGIVPRVRARTKLKDQTDALAAPAVIVNPPHPGETGQEIILPGNVYAYSDTLLYARTDGYLSKWYFDIGAHVRRGQLLAVISVS